MINSNTGLILVATIGWLILTALVLFSPKIAVYDEGFHITALKRVSADGLQTGLRKSYSSGGPAFVGIQFGLRSLTNFDPKCMRVVNLFMSFGIGLFMIAISSELGLHLQWQFTGAILAVPFVWPIMGMALTDAPSIIGILGFVLFAIKFLKLENTSCKQGFVYGFVAGLFLSFACLCRHTSIVLIAGLIPFVFKSRATFFFSAVSCTLSLFSVAWVFMLWGGIVPPNLKSMSGGLSFEHFLLGWAYFGIAILIISPANITMLRPSLLVAAILLSLTNFLAPVIKICPAYVLISRLLPENEVAIYQQFVSYGLLILALLSILSVIIKLNKSESCDMRLFIGVCICAIVSTPILIAHQFSSRYILPAIFLLFALYWTCFIKSGFMLARMSLGIATGAAMLNVYYNQS